MHSTLLVLLITLSLAPLTYVAKIKATEEYSEMRADGALDSKLFDAQYWMSVHWREWKGAARASLV